MTEPALAEGALDRRVPPRGVAGARLMVVAAAVRRRWRWPADRRRRSSPSAAILRAMGIAEHEVYFASALPAPMAMPEWDRLAQPASARSRGTTSRSPRRSESCFRPRAARAVRHRARTGARAAVGRLQRHRPMRCSPHPTCAIWPARPCAGRISGTAGWTGPDDPTPPRRRPHCWRHPLLSPRPRP